MAFGGEGRKEGRLTDHRRHGPLRALPRRRRAHRARVLLLQVLLLLRRRRRRLLRRRDLGNEVGEEGAVRGEVQAAQPQGDRIRLHGALFWFVCTYMCVCVCV